MFVEIFKNSVWGYRLISSGSGQGLLAGCCERKYKLNLCLNLFLCTTWRHIWEWRYISTHC